MTHGPESASNRRASLVMAQVSLAIVFVFIVCHSIKWIPNVYELLQVRNFHLTLSFTKTLGSGINVGACLLIFGAVFQGLRPY